MFPTSVYLFSANGEGCDNFQFSTSPQDQHLYMIFCIMCNVLNCQNSSLCLHCRHFILVMAQSHTKFQGKINDQIVHTPDAG